MKERVVRSLRVLWHDLGQLREAIARARDQAFRVLRAPEEKKILERHFLFLRVREAKRWLRYISHDIDEFRLVMEEAETKLTPEEWDLVEEAGMLARGIEEDAREALRHLTEMDIPSTAYLARFLSGLGMTRGRIEAILERLE